MSDDSSLSDDMAIAIVGMAGRFPGARDYRVLWSNVREGIESVRRLTQQELDDLQVPAQVRSHPDFVPASSFMDDFDCFDAEFFGMHPREAQELDPQHRVFLECAWAALEDAGYGDGLPDGRVSVYAGSTLSSYLLFNLVPHYLGESTTMLREFQLGMGNSSDFLATRVAYKLNLTGPSYTVLTGCSSSLVAVHIAAQSLLLGDCDIALSGGVSIQVNNRAGYIFTPEGLVSPDGHCRPFDANASGTVLGSGAGIVVLKRLADAIASGDTVRAVILGSAINNDGNRKVGFTAPSVDGQAAVIVQALAAAGVSADTVGYVEAHGTATQLGDSIELQALTKAYRQSTQSVGFCALGSIKSNIGHLDAAAGVTGLIKAVQAVEHGQLPPSLHFSVPNAGLEHSPFYVNDQLRSWPSGAAPRRAAVSSFGIGGTNAHVVLQAPPPASPRPARGERSWQVLQFSARSQGVLQEATQNIRQHLAVTPGIDIADVAHTLRAGRRAFACRRYVVCRDVDDVPRALDADKAEWTGTGHAEPGRRTAFLLPGMGPQHQGMAADLYRTEPVFREHFDICSDILEPVLGVSVRQSLFGSGGPPPQQPEVLRAPAAALPTVVAAEYALARLLGSVGVEPTALLGHSVGEYTAACLAGVLSLADCLAIVHRRGELGASLAPGAMVNVALPERELGPMLTGDLSLAAVNGPRSCVVSGPAAEVRAWTEQLAQRDVPHWELPWPVAGHSVLVDPVLEEFTSFLGGFTFRAPSIPVISNLTGTTAGEEIIDPAYWARHLRETVRFADGVRALAGLADVLIEVGPGQSLSKMAASSLTEQPTVVIPVMRHPKNECGDDQHFAAALGRLWTVGVPVRWSGARAAGDRKIPLPTYPFRRQRFWIDPPRQPLTTVSPAPAPPESTPAAPPAVAAGDAAAPRPVLPMSDGEPSRAWRFQRDVQDILAAVSGRAPDQIDIAVNFFQLGFESLALAEAGTAINRKFGVRIPIQLMFESLPTVQALADYLDRQLPPGERGSERPQPAAQPSAASAAGPPAEPGADPAGGAARDLMAQQLDLLRQQMELQQAIINRQLDLLGQPGGMQAAALAEPATPVRQDSLPARASDSHVPGTFAPETRAPESFVPESFVPFQPAQLRAEPLTEQQRRHVDDLVRRYTARTRGSRDRVQRSRYVRANHRNVLNFRPMWKELVYPIFATSGKAGRIWDVDGNEYVDLAMSFGANMLGHAPSFVIDAVSQELVSGQGLLIGPCTPHAEEVARLISDMTGVERVAFFNSGTEAVMLALRLARAATGRGKIAMFAGSFHGTYDGTLVMPDPLDGGTTPICRGLSPGITGDVMVLDYCSAQSLDLLRQEGHNLAAVLVEPVQSRRPSLDAGPFLRDLRAVTSNAGTALIFDETITGFRLHPGGAQALFGVTADLVTFGKVVGGGMPLGIVAGSSRFMDGVDGGMWSFGDDSAPENEGRRTFLGGTFCEHPLTMTSTRAVLQHLKNEGPALQEGLASRSERLAARLRAAFDEFGAPIEVEQFSSIFRLRVPRNLELFYYHMLNNGVYFWEGRTWFLSTAHTDADLDLVLRATRESLAELRSGGFLRESSPRSPVAPATRSELADGGLPRATDEQQQLWFQAHLGSEWACVYSDSVALSIEGPANIGALRRALQRVVDRHDALRTEFTADGEYLRVHRDCPLTVGVLDWTDTGACDRSGRLGTWWHEQMRTPIFLDSPPLLRANVIRFSDREHTLVVVAHHLALDGWSWGIVLRELGHLYLEEAGTSVGPLPEAARYEDFIKQRADLLAGQEAVAAMTYWSQVLGDPPTALAPAPDRISPAEPPHRGGREQAVLPADLYQAVASTAQALECTIPILLMAAYQAFLHGLTGRSAFLVSVPTAGQLSLGMADLVGHCTNLLPISARLDPQEPFAVLVQRVRADMSAAYTHQAVSVSALAADAPAGQRPLEIPPIAALFNVDRRVALPALPGLTIDVRTGPQLFAHGLLGLNAIDIGGTMRLDLDYDADRFGPRLCRLWLLNFQELLRAATADPRAELRMLLRAETVPGSQEPPAVGQLPSPPWQCTLELADHTARGPAASVNAGGATLTQQELRDRAIALACRLRAVGIGAGSVVGLDLPAGSELAIAALGALTAGAAIAVLDDLAAPGRLAAIVRADTAVCPRMPQVQVISVGEAASDQAVPDQEAVDLDRLVPPSAPAWLVGTSGGTDIMLTRAQLVEHLGRLADLLGVGAGCRIALASPADPALFVERLLLALSLGCALQVLPGVVDSPGELVDRTVRLAGIPVTIGVRAAQAQEPAAAGFIGTPAGSLLFPVAVCDDHGEARPAGVPGELCLRLADQSAGRAGPALSLATGYHARWTADGQLDVLGAADRTANVDGETVWLDSIETVLRRARGVAGVTVTAQPAGSAGGGAGPPRARLVACVTPVHPDDPGGHEDLADQVRAYAVAALPSRYVPHHVMIASDLPDSPAGPAPQPATSPVPAHGEPADDLDQRLLALCQDLIGEPVTLDESFIGMGGTSLLAIRALSRIHRDFGVRLPLSALFQAATLSDLAGAVRAGRQEAAGWPDDDLEPPLVAADHSAPYYPLSSAQQRIWFTDQAGGDRSYVVPIVMEVIGHLDVAAFRAGLDELVGRHEALRTTFPVIDDTPVQRIGPPFHVAVDELDLSHLPTAEQEARGADYYRSEADRPFDLVYGPLLRVGLLRLADDRHLIVLALHHIITDGWSGDILLDDFLEYYQAFRAHREASLPQLPVQYRDFATWQQEWLKGQRGSRQLDYWRQELAGHSLVLELPADHPRSPVQTYNGRDHRIALSVNLSKTLRGFSRAEGVTLFSTMLAAFAALLRVYSGQDDIVVGTPAANRSRIETERLVGCFLNMLAIRTNLAGGQSFRELVHRVQERVTAAHANQDIPMEKLVEALVGSSRELSSSPLFQMLFVLNEVPARRQVADLELSFVRFPRVISKYDLALIVDDTGDELLLDFQYNTDLFNSGTIELMASRFQAFLDNVAANPQAAV